MKSKYDNDGLFEIIHDYRKLGGKVSAYRGLIVHLEGENVGADRISQLEAQVKMIDYTLAKLREE